MSGYLLDTNHVNAYFDQSPSFIRRLEGADPQWCFWISAVSLGEIEASYLIANRDVTVVQSFRRFVRQTFLTGRDDNAFVLQIDENTREWYAEIIDGIWKRHPPPSGKTRTEAHIVGLGVDINDVWIAATALKHNLTLLTTDKMQLIKEVSPSLVYDNWC